MTVHNTCSIGAAGVLMLCSGQTVAQPSDQSGPASRSVVLQASNTPDDFNHPGPNYNIFDANQTDDHAIYYSAADWMRDPDSGLYLDGLVDPIPFGMSFGNYGFDYPEGFDRQVKHLQEYMLAPAYDAGVTAASLVSATLTVTVDRVIDMSLQNCTDCVAPEWMYIAVFAGDGYLTTRNDAQLDYDRCDRLFPETWDITHHMVSDRGNRWSDDEIDFYGGKITLEIDVTSNVRDLLAAAEGFAGFTLAGSHDADFTITSLDGGTYPTTTLPTLTLVNSAPLIPIGVTPTQLPTPSPCPDTGRDTTTMASSELGDFNRDGRVDQQDRAYYMDSYLRSINGTSPWSAIADFDRDGDVDPHDLAQFRSLFDK